MTDTGPRCHGQRRSCQRLRPRRGSPRSLVSAAAVGCRTAGYADQQTVSQPLRPPMHSRIELPMATLEASPGHGEPLCGRQDVSSAEWFASQFQAPDDDQTIVAVSLSVIPMLPLVVVKARREHRAWRSA